MTVRLYLDEDSMDHDLVEALRLRGVDVATPAEVGMIEQPDEAHLARAAAEGRVLYSFNIQDFYRLHTDYLSAGQHQHPFPPSDCRLLETRFPLKSPVFNLPPDE